MAHMCMNRLNIKGNEQDIMMFQRLVAQAASNFRGVTNNVHDVYVDEEKIGESHVCYVYESKWSPIENLTEQLATSFPNLTFRLDYHEHGSEVYGVETWRKGKLIKVTTIEDFTDEKELREWFQKEGFFELSKRCMYCDCLIHQQEIVDEDDCPYCHKELQ